MKKTTILLLFLLLLCSCVNTNKIEIQSISQASVRSLSLSSFVIHSNVVISNRTSKVEIKELYAEIFQSNSSIAVLKVDDPILIDKGVNEIPVTLKISLRNPLLGYASIVSAFGSDLKTVKITGYVVVKSPMGSKTIDFEEFPLSDLASQKSFDGLFQNLFGEKNRN